MLQRLVLRLGEDLIAPHTAWVFRQALYLIVLLNTLVLLPIAGQVWGPDAYMLNYHRFGEAYYFLLGLLLRPEVAPYFWFFVIGQIVVLVLALTRILPFWTAFLVYFFTQVLFIRSIELSTGGHHIVQIELTFLLGLSLAVSPKRGNTLSRWARNTIANLSFYSVQLQLAVMYLFSGIYKIRGELWPGGEAMYYVMSIPEYSHPWIMEYVPALGWLLVPLNYVVLGYQFAFPVLVWFKRIRPWLLLVGLGFHLSIVFMVGITDFGLFMVVSYLIFLPEAQAKKWLTRLGRVLPQFLVKLLVPKGLAVVHPAAAPVSKRPEAES